MKYVNLKRQSKSEEIRSIIIQAIMDREYALGDKLPSEEVIAERFSVGRATVREAIISLVHEGILERSPKRGTFVAGITNKLNMENTVALFLRTHGHLFGKLASELVRSLQASDLLSILVDCYPAYEDKYNDYEMMKRVINSVPASVIADGKVFSVLAPLLQEPNRELRTVYVINFPFEAYEFPEGASFVMSDFHQGGYIAAKHLLGMGHRKILFLTYSVEEIEKYHVDGFDIPRRYSVERFVCGCSDAYSDSGLSFRSNFSIAYDSFKEPDRTEAMLTEILSSPDRPTAVISHADYSCISVYNAARKAGLKIPDDVAVVGYYDTPHAESLSVPLTSISIREDKIAEKAVAVAKGDENKEVFVKPELIIRASCGGKEKVPMEMAWG